ncbi:MAG: HAD family hydrolase, partial [Malacoplasma sp.]|nr:HAD family hydrolase [Malacoplasma sp.]
NRKIVTKAINEINEKLGDKVNVFPHDVYFFEISPSGVNKGEAIKFVAKRLDILMNHVAACGDTANDIDGFKACKLSAAIRTFNPTVIANASVHIKKSRAGVSEFIYKYLIQDVPKVKMVVTDLDGTLYTNNEKNIVKETIDVINKAVPDKIQYFCIASGRSAADTYRAIEQLGVKNDKNMFIVGVNGAAVYDVEHRREIYSTWLKYTDVKMLFKLYERISKEIPMGVIIHNYDKDKTIEAIKTKGEVIPKMYCKNRPFIIKQLQALSKGFFTKYNRMENYHELEGCPTWLTVSKIIFQFDNPEDRAKAFKIVDSMHLPLSVSRSVGKNIEFNNPTINKAVGLKKLCEYLHIEPNETLVCGDEGNDKPMMKLTEWSYCLAISSQDVKDSCKFVLDSKPSYFVGEAINEYLKTIGEK